MRSLLPWKKNMQLFKTWNFKFLFIFVGHWIRIRNTVTTITIKMGLKMGRKDNYLPWDRLNFITRLPELQLWPLPVNNNWRLLIWCNTFFSSGCTARRLLSAARVTLVSTKSAWWAHRWRPATACWAGTIPASTAPPVCRSPARQVQQPVRGAFSLDYARGRLQRTRLEPSRLLRLHWCAAPQPGKYSSRSVAPLVSITPEAG